MHASFRRVVAVALAVIGSAAVLTPAATSVASAAPAGDASLSGTVTRAADGTPVAGVTVYADGDAGAATAETGADGRYTIAGLAAGAYILEFSPPIVDDRPPELAHEYWDGVRAPDLATPVEVPAGGAVSGIDASLEATGSISGVVTRAGNGHPVAGATVHFQPEDHTMGFSTTSGADGTYTLEGVVPGRHFVEFWTDDEGLLDVTWPDALDRGAAEPVTVTAGAETPGIDAALPAAAIVSGVVRRDGATWTDGGTVMLDAVDGGADASTVVGLDGAFRVGKVMPGRYVASVRPAVGAARGALQFYDRADAPSAATTLTLAGGTTRAGVDFDLRVGVDLSGTVTAEGELAAPVEVVAYVRVGSRWEEVARTSTWRDFSFADPPGDVEGVYLPPGRYAVGFFAEGHCPEYFDDVPSLADAHATDLAPGAEAWDVNADLSAECTLTPVRAGTPKVVGEPVVGETLVARPGTWHPRGVSFAYQWLMDGDHIAGATASRLELTPTMKGRRIAVAVTGTREGYAGTTVRSRSTAPVSVAVAALPTLELAGGAVVRGGQVRVSGAGFGPGASIDLSLRSAPVHLATARADAAGAFAITVRIPSDAAVGVHAVVAEVDGAEVVRIDLRVVAGTLPQAGGSPPWGLAAGGLLALVVGILMLRHRPRHGAP